MPMLSSRFYRLVIMAMLSTASAAAGAAGVVVQVTDAAGKPVENAVVYAESESGQPLPGPKKSGEISQKGLKFIPLVTVIQTGSKVFFPNNDKVRHHIYSFSPAHKFDPWNVPGRYGWVGGTGTTAHIVPSTGAVAILLTQVSMTSPVAPAIMRDFWRYAA